MRVLFIGHFAPPAGNVKPLKGDDAISTAGNSIQKQIHEELLVSPLVRDVSCYSMQPRASWPAGSLTQPHHHHDKVTYPGFINIPIVKNIHFSVSIISKLIKSRPDVIVQYNSYLFENIAILIYCGITKARSCIIIQDVHVSRDFRSVRTLVRSVYEKVGLRIARGFDYIVPVSRHIIDDFGFSCRRHHIFPGGITSLAKEVSENNPSLEHYAVFAGSLSPHNGIDVVAETWAKERIPYILHIFGKGPLSQFIKSIAEKSDNIVYHGFQEEAVVSKYTSRALWNICFRVSKGIDQRYFFPSKFFNVIVAQGRVVTNDGFDAPLDLKDLTISTPDNGSGLKELILRTNTIPTKSEITARREYVLNRYNWGAMLDRIIRGQRHDNKE